MNIHNLRMVPTCTMDLMAVATWSVFTRSIFPAAGPTIDFQWFDRFMVTGKAASSACFLEVLTLVLEVETGGKGNSISNKMLQLSGIIILERASERISHMSIRKKVLRMCFCSGDFTLQSDCQLGGLRQWRIDRQINSHSVEG